MDKPRLFDVVQIKTARPEHGLVGGENGTIVEVFDTPDESYEVEFADKYGETIAMFSMTADEFEVVWRAPIRAEAAR